METCNVIAFSGTSMSTPVTAGNAALIRQYFENSSFWQRECSYYSMNCKPFLPSGPLIKALLISSGEPMYAYAASNISVIGDTILGAPPDYFQGYGRVLLGNILPLRGYTSDAMQLFVENSVEMTESTIRKYSVVVQNSSLPFVFTISWYDPPNVFWSAKAVLNDIGKKDICIYYLVILE